MVVVVVRHIEELYPDLFSNSFFFIDRFLLKVKGQRGPPPTKKKKKNFLFSQKGKLFLLLLLLLLRLLRLLLRLLLP